MFRYETFVHGQGFGLAKLRLWHTKSYENPLYSASGMSERQKQREFLKGLLGFAGSPVRRDLHDRMLKAEHDEKCVRSALILVGLVALFSVSGLGYSAVLLPEFFDSSTPLLVKLFCALGLGSVLCMIVFLGCWIWYRSIANRLHDECRHIVMESLGTRITTERAAHLSRTVTPVNFTGDDDTGSALAG